MSALAYRHHRVQRLRRLLGRRSARREEGRFVLEGANLLEEALAAGVEVEAVFVDEGAMAAGAPGTDRPARASVGGADDEDEEISVWDEQEARHLGAPVRVASLVKRCFESGARVFGLQSGVMARVAGTVSPQPVMAVVAMPVHDLAAVREAGPRLVVVCVDVRDPGNAGTVVRSAWAAGVDAVVCCEGTVDMWNPKAVRSSAGAVLHVPVVQAGGADLVLAELGEWGLVRWGTAVGLGTDYACADLTQPCAVVVGNEAAGLPLDRLGGALDGVLNIPMPGGAESLNVGMAAAVICFEAARQRRLEPLGQKRLTSPGEAI